jgi:nucleoside 2-deoxyribosyltransferase
MNKEGKITVYLSGPMDNCTVEECRAWREKIIKDMPEINFLDPCRRDYSDPGTNQSEEAYTDIVESDKKDINESDIVLVYHDRPSVGTSMEILLAWDRGIYVITVGATGKPLSPWILYHSNEIVDTLEEAKERLQKHSKRFSAYESGIPEDDL